MIKLKNLPAHVKFLFQMPRYFKHPWLITLLRLGVIKQPYFLHQITNGDKYYQMLARPSTTASGDFFVLKEVLLYDTYRDVLPLLNKKNIRLVDIGANMGSFTIWMNQALGVREAYCFEPEPDSFRLLNFNLSLNNCFTAKPLECAVGGEARTIQISLKKENPAATTIYDQPSSSAGATSKSVPVITLESWLNGIEGDFDLLKVDCEGAEWEILSKTPPQIFTRFAVFIAEVHEDPENKHSVSDFKGMVEKLGYRTVRWDNTAQGLYVGVRDV